MYNKPKKIKFLPMTLPDHGASVVADLMNNPMGALEKINIAERYIDRHKYPFNWIPLYLTKDEKNLFIYKKLLTGCLGRIQVLDNKYDEDGNITVHGVVYGITINQSASKTGEPYIFSWVDTDARFALEKEKQEIYKAIEKKIKA